MLVHLAPLVCGRLARYGQPSEAGTVKTAALRRELGFADLVLFNLAAVLGVRWLAAAARIGPPALTLWLLAAALFFVPSALAVSKLSARYPEEGGIYVWTRHCFGHWHGFLCAWCYWLSNLFYFPNLLLAGLAMAASAGGEHGRMLAENRLLLVIGSLILLWAGSLTNMLGVRVGKWTENVGALGTYAAGLLLVAAGLAVTAKTRLAIRWQAVWPRWNWGTVNFWSQIAFAFGGLELGAVMGGEIRDASRTVPRAAWTSAAAIAGFYVAGTAAILVVLPSDCIDILTGLAQAGQAAARALGARWIGPALAGLVTAGIAGQLGAWLAGAARLPFVLGIDRYLPPVFARLHPRWGTPHLVILLESGACTLFLLAMQIGESPRGAYQLLVDMTVVSYFLPFAYLFLCARRHGLRVSSMAGLAVTLLAIAVSLVPPAEAAHPWLFEAKLLGGCTLLIAAARIVYHRARPQ